MTFVDTSIIVRYLVGSSESLFEEAETIPEHTPKLVITDVALAKVFFVLNSVYKVPRDKLIDVLVTLVQRRNIQIFGLTKEVIIKGCCCAALRDVSRCPMRSFGQQHSLLVTRWQLCTRLTSGFPLKASSCGRRFEARGHQTKS